MKRFIFLLISFILKVSSILTAQESPWIKFNNMTVGFLEIIAGLEVDSGSIVLSSSGYCSFDSVNRCPAFKSYYDNGDIADSITVSSFFENGNCFFKHNSSQSKKLRNGLVASFFSNAEPGKLKNSVVLISDFKLNVRHAIILSSPTYHLIPPYDAAMINDSTLLVFGYRYINKISNGSIYLCHYNLNTGESQFYPVQANLKYYRVESAHFVFQNANSMLLSVDASTKSMDFFNSMHYVIKSNAKGEVEWIYCDSILDASSRIAKWEIVRLSNGNSVHSIRYQGKDFNPGKASTRTALRFLSPEGKHLWDTELSDSCFCRKQSNGGIFKCQNDDVIGTGHYKKINQMPYGSPHQIWIYRVSPTGTLKWSKQYAYEKVFTSHVPLPVISFFQGENIRESESKFIYVNGNASLVGKDDAIFILKVDSMGCMTPGCTSDDVFLGADPTVTDEAIKLREYFYKLGPNPFTTELTIEMVNPQPGRAMDLMLYDMSGKMISKLKDVNTKGMYQMNTEGLPLGMYILNLMMDGRLIQVDKVVKQ